MSTGDSPIEAARRLTRPEAPKRFYKTAHAAPSGDGFAVLLDGRAVRTPAKNPLAVPTEALAAALAAEWQAQSEVINPASMPLTRLVNAALDGVAPNAAAVLEEVVKYAASDLVCYRADAPDRLVARQGAAWNPVLDWAHRKLGARFLLAEGVVFVTQPDTSLAAVRASLEPLDIFRLAAVNVMTTLTGSALIALAVLHGRLSSDEAWAAAHVDEDWNIELWGLDAEAAERRVARFAEMQAAARLLALA